MSNKPVALVTGAASGIGQATAERLGREGHAVMLADLNREALEEAVQALGQNGIEAAGEAVNVAEASSVEKLVARCVESFGRLDCLVNSAGINPEQVPLHQYTLEGWQRELSVNLSGSFYTIRYAVPHMLEAGAGAIVNIASIMGAAGSPNSAGYVASKHGVVGLTKTAALDYASQGIRVNAVGPGVIETPMSEPMRNNQQVHDMLMQATPMRRFGKPEDVAALIYFLCSPDAGFITGHYYPVDGGYLVP